MDDTQLDRANEIKEHLNFYEKVEAKLFDIELEIRKNNANDIIELHEVISKFDIELSQGIIDRLLECAKEYSKVHIKNLNQEFKNL